MKRRDFLKLSAAGCGAFLAGQAGIRHAAAVQPVHRWTRQEVSQRSLSSHRLDRIQTWRISERFPRFVGRNARRGPSGRGSSYQVRRLTTDTGISGWGMSYGPDDPINRFKGAKLSELFDVEKGTRDELRPIQMPLFDLVGRALGKPVYEILGGRGPTKIPIYSGAIYFEDLEDRHRQKGIDAVLAACQQDYRAGYRAFKLKMGRGHKWMEPDEGLQRDIEVTRAVRERFPDCKVLVDANNGWSVEHAARYVEAVADCDLFWIEEPFEENREGLLRLRDAMEKAGCSAYIAEGEARKEQAKELWRYGGYTKKFVERLYALAEEKLVDVFVMDLGIVGFSNWWRIMPELRKAGVKASPHLWVWSPRPYYCAHLAAGVGNVLIIEGIPARSKNIDYSAFKIKDGNLHVPEKPGWGLGLKM